MMNFKIIIIKYKELIILFIFLFTCALFYYYEKKIKYKDVFEYGIKSKACIDNIWTGTDNDPQMSYIFKFDNKYYYGNYAIDPDLFVIKGVKVNIEDSITVCFLKNNPKKNILAVDLYEYYADKNIYYHEMYN